jgi:hypothetical protein
MGERTPREIIDEIRRKNFLIGVEMSPEIAEGTRNILEDYNNALKTLSEDLYSKDTHFVLELVQNADDNDYPKSAEPEISFRLSADCIVVQNNEIGFNDRNVQALCRVRQSTKKKQKSAGFIGEKGIGFKSVFTATDRPEIHSNGYHFRFDRTDESHVLGFVVPHWCDDGGHPQEVTTIVLPAKKDSAFTNEKLAELSDELLLFLRKLRKISVFDQIDGVIRKFRRRDVSGIVCLTSESEKLGGLQPDVTERRYKYVEHSYSTADLKEEKRPEVEGASIVLAFPLAEDRSAAADSSQQLYAFLPVRDYGFRFLVQGDFLLSSSREDVHKSPVWNKRARDEIAKAFVRALEPFKHDVALKYSFLQFVPRKGDITDPFFLEAGEKILAELKEADCVLAESKEWRKPREVINADDDLREIFPNEDVKRILGVEYVSRDLKAPQATLDRLGVGTANAQTLLALIEKDAEMPGRPIAWLQALYRYCDKKLSSDTLVKKFQALAAIKLDSGEMRQLVGPTIYFPLQRGKRYGFEHELPLLHSDLVVGQGADDVQKFLARVGVKRSEPYWLVVHHILPKHAVTDWPSDYRSVLSGHVAYIKDNLPRFLKGATEAGESQPLALSRLGAGLFLQSKAKLEDGRCVFERAGRMYLSDAFRPPIMLERLLRGVADQTHFVSETYLGEPGDGEGEEEARGRASWRDFFYALGVNSFPVVESVQAGGGTDIDWEAGAELAHLLVAEDLRTRKRTIELLDRNWNHYSKYLEARSIPRRGGPIVRASKLRLAISSMKAPSKRRGEFTLSQTYRDVEHVRAVFGESVPYLDADVANADFLDAVNVTHRVDAAACTKRLDQLRTLEKVNTRVVKTIYRELERLVPAEGSLVKNAFEEEARIYVPSIRKWFTARDVVWIFGGEFMDRHCPSLETAYREHQTFFVRHLEVHREASDGALIKALPSLEEYGESHSVRKNEALRIYRRLAKSLREYQLEHPDDEPEWISTARSEAIFLDHMDRMVQVDNDMYIADDARLATAFMAHERISILAVDSWQVYPLLDLLELAGMKKLSAVAKYELGAVDDSALDADTTRRIRERSSHLMRLLYAKAHRAFDRASRQGLWSDLRSLEVRTAPALEVEAVISDNRARVPTDTYRQGTTIYVQAGTRGRLDKIANELCLFFGEKPEGLAESVYRVLTAGTEEDLQDFFDVKGVPDIPGDELTKILAEYREEESKSEAAAESEAETAESDDAESESETNTADVQPPPSTEPKPIVTRILSPTEREKEPQTTTAATPPSRTSSSTPARRREQQRRPGGRLLSYAEPKTSSEDKETNDETGENEARLAIAKAAVDYVLSEERRIGHDVVEMPFNNEGFDIQRSAGAIQEYIEVKGLSGAWGAEGLVVTPAELRMAERERGRYWLFVVEYAQLPEFRRAYRIRDPFGQIDQFRFDSGWKEVAEGAVAALEPAEGRRMEKSDGSEAGVILTVVEAGVLRKLRVRLDSGEEVDRIFDPSKMVISEVA